ncbi:35565_t:CDS:2 [Gigaspora margarita]|uniref:35565_t:CDS:1 n=1 Tax=Gigaspora margarita TaxID=4874 RepID=A0ABN7V620_GIGMA|nr:35565_t:CDS:2 [Gigaspora margarita]
MSKLISKIKNLKPPATSANIISEVDEMRKRVTDLTKVEIERIEPKDITCEEHPQCIYTTPGNTGPKETRTEYASATTNSSCNKYVNTNRKTTRNNNRTSGYPMADSRKDTDNPNKHNTTESKKDSMLKKCLNKAKLKLFREICEKLEAHKNPTLRLKKPNPFTFNRIEKGDNSKWIVTKTEV